MYALTLDPESGRVLSATYPKYAIPGLPMVDALPEGNIGDWLYVNGEYVYDPLPEEEPEPTLEERVDELTQQNEVLLQCLLEMSEIVYA